MSPLRKPRLGLDRDSALAARPRQAPIAATKERPDGGLVVTLRVRRPRWQQLLGAASGGERSFGLDAYGRDVFEACNGKRSVKAIVRRFAKAHHVSMAEAEMSVTAFLKTLLSRGMIGMEVERPRKRKRGHG